MPEPLPFSEEAPVNMSMNSPRIPRRSGTVALTLALLATVALDPAEAVGNVKAGRQKARVCEACHGLDGRSKVPEAPNLAGQVENYLIQQLRAFGSGARRSELMSVIAPTLSPQDIEDLAAYYAAIEITVGKIPGE
jgi:cytochrome c553